MDPGADLTDVDDRALLAGGVADAVLEAQANARRWARLVEFHRAASWTSGRGRRSSRTSP
jgi:hypothetical protein